MTPRLLLTSYAALFALGLQGQEMPSRYGIALGAAVPQDLKASPGIAIGLNIHLNQNSLSEGRIRIEGVNFGSKTDTTSLYSIGSNGSAYTLSYDWTPGTGIVHPILGIGVMSWTQELEQQDSGPLLGYKGYGGSRSGFAIVPTVGVQFRVSKYLYIEGRYAAALNVSNNKNYFFSYDASNSVRQMQYLALGVEFRIPPI